MKAREKKESNAKNKVPRIIVTGGGSGGHLSPALAVMQQIRQQCPEAEILYLGGRLAMEGVRQPSLEQKILPQTPWPHRFIHAGKLQRRFSLSSLWLLKGVLPGLIESFYHLLHFRPAVVFSTGGYVSVPVVIAAWLLRIPILIHEQTAALGLSNRLAAYLAHEIFITFRSSLKYFPPHKTTLTGNPLRAEVLQARQRRQKKKKKQELKTIYLTGGAQGSHLLNQTVLPLLPELTKQYRLIHQCGDNPRYHDYEKLKKAREKLSPSQQKNYHLIPYLSAEELKEVWTAADLLIGRAGANTVYESMVLGLPTIFIPIPWVTNNEQYKNARVVVNAGSGRILREEELSPSRLGEEIENLAANYEEYWQRAQSLSAEVPLRASEKIAAKILRYAT